MAYRLRTNESVAKGLRRVVRQELRAAIDQLARGQASDKAIHEARKSIKKVRAVLQLVGEDVDAGRAVKELRRAGRLLSPLRDANAVMSSARALCARERSALSAKMCSALHDRLAREKVRLTRVARHDRVNDEAAESLRKAQRSVKGCDWKKVGISVFAAEIRRSYKNARRAMRQARDANTSDDFHAWRKRVKTLWYALRLVERRMQPLGRRLTALDRLQTWLGEDHNLLVLRTPFIMGPRVAGVGAVKGLAERRQQELRRKALRLGARQFGHKPKEFAREFFSKRRDH